VPNKETPVEGSYPDVPERVLNLPHMTAIVTLFKPSTRRNMPSGMHIPAWIGREITPEGWPIVHDVAVYLEHAEPLLPGGRARALVYPISPSHWPPLQQGSTFELWDAKPFAEVEVVTPLG